jgi:type IV pilus assembly protein PilC
MAGTSKAQQIAESLGVGNNFEDMIKRMRNIRVEFGPSRKEILAFTNQLSVMVRAGIGLKDALESIGEQQSNERFKNIILDVKNKIEEGRSFSQALRPYTDVFGGLYINMIAAAEISGAMSDMLQKLAGYLDQEAQTRSQIRGAMVYPMIIGFMAISVSIFLLCFVLPKFSGIFAGKEHLLPVSTKILLGTSAFFRGWWFVIVPVVLAIIGALNYFTKTNVGHIWWDKTKLRLPLVKTICRNLYITRSLHTMSVLTSAGVPILDTISITSQISGNVFYERMWNDVHDDVRQGGKIADNLTRFNLLPSDVIQMIKSGEESGTMSKVLGDISDYYSRELKNVIKTVTSMIEPIMIVLMGILVGFIAMSVMLPIFKMSSVVSG